MSESAYQLAERLAKQIQQRTGLKPRELKCPREKSPMTPCIARDGKLALMFTTAGQPICVGCTIPLDELRQIEDQKNASSAH